MAVDRAFEEDYDRAAGAGAELRRLRRMPAGEKASGAEIGERIRQLDRRDQTAALDALTVPARAGDSAAREELVVRALPLVIRQAKRYAGRDVDLGDLTQEGVIGLLRAVERYDPERGVPFAAYAGWWMRQAMQQAVAEQSRAVRLPTRVLWDLHDLREAQRCAPADSDERVARSLGWSDGRVAEVLRAERPALSLDAAYPGDDDAVSPLGDLIADPLSEAGYERILSELTGRRVRALLTTLTDRERQVLVWRFGLEGEELSLRQIGRRLGISAERVRQLEQRALTKLRTAALPREGLTPASG